MLYSECAYHVYQIYNKETRKTAWLNVEKKKLPVKYATTRTSTRTAFIDPAQSIIVNVIQPISVSMKISLLGQYYLKRVFSWETLGILVVV